MAQEQESLGDNEVCFKIDFTPSPIDRIRLPFVAREWRTLEYHTIIEETARAVAKLEIMVKMYPDHPMILNWLVLAYCMNKQDDEAYLLSIRNYQSNPEYLFAKCTYALYLIKKGNCAIVPAVFNNEEFIGDVYPDYDVFHISEVEQFYKVWGLYFVHTFDLEGVENVIELLTSFDPDLSAISLLTWQYRLLLLREKPGTFLKTMGTNLFNKLRKKDKLT